VVKCSGVLQCIDGLSNKVSNIIRRLMDDMKLLLIPLAYTTHVYVFYEYYYHISSYSLGSIFLLMYIWFYSCLLM
jgi:hypothetical protein